MYRFVILMLVAVAAVGARAEDVTPSKPLNLISLTGGVHFERRSGATSENADFYLQYDRLIAPESDIYIGARGGLYFQKLLTPSITAVAQPFFGVHGYKMFQAGNDFSFKLGAVVEGHAGDSVDPIYLWIAAESGVRYTQPSYYLELPMEWGSFPFFSGAGLFYRVGLQVGIPF